jgi:hypothetical protein
VSSLISFLPPQILSPHIFVRAFVCGTFHTFILMSGDSSEVRRGPLEPLDVGSGPKFSLHATSSTAGAGSGDFHIFRKLRRAELDRIDKMERTVEEEEKNREFSEKLEGRQEAIERKREKKAEKRKRRKKETEKRRKTTDQEGTGPLEQIKDEDVSISEEK